MSTLRFLDCWFSDCLDGAVEVRALPTGLRAWTTPGAWSNLGPFLTDQTRARQSITLGLATRCDTSSGRTDNLAALPGVWIDLDTRADLDGFPFRPAATVRSGHHDHRHWYWRFREPLNLRAPGHLSRAASVLRRLAGYFGADDGACDPARTLRLPGCYSFKYADPRLVTLLDVSSATVDLSELEEFLPREVVRRNVMVLEAGIPIGHRHNQLFALGRAMRARGVGYAGIEAALTAVNRTQTEEPLREGEIRQLILDVVRTPDRPGFAVQPLAALGDGRPGEGKTKTLLPPTSTCTYRNGAGDGTGTSNSTGSVFSFSSSPLRTAISSTGSGTRTGTGNDTRPAQEE